MAKYLLDTHIFIWVNQEPKKLSDEMRAILGNSNNELFLSIASIWEMQIKIQLGKLVIKPSLSEVLNAIKQDNTYDILPILDSHILNLQNLPPIHKDPFDRILFSQSQIEKLELLTVDENLNQYKLDSIL